MDIALATCAAYPNLSEGDQHLPAAFAAQGLDARAVVWNDPAEPWREAGTVLIRSAWDSHLQPDAFRAWAQAVDAQARLYNPARLVTWNLHKAYLKALASRGVPVTPTVWFDRGHAPNLIDTLDRSGWPRLVVKPAISAGAAGVCVVDRATALEQQAAVDALAAAHDLMLQPYLDAFETEGERSYIFIGGQFSHAVQRPPTLASAQRGFDAPRAIPQPVPAELRLTQAVTAALPEGWLYARVDVATNNDGVVRLQEVELIEPALFLSLDPGATQRLVHALIARMGAEANRS